MNLWRVSRLGLPLIVMVCIAGMLTALAAANSVPASGKLDTTVALTVKHLQPQDCNSLNLTSYAVTASGFYVGGDDSELIIGGSGNNFIFSVGGDDCVVGGAGGDYLFGGDGTNICFGNPSTYFADCTPSYTALRP